jgi:hypothetical protein
MGKGGHFFTLEQTKDSSTIKASSNMTLWFRLSNCHEDDQRESWDGPDWSGSRMEVDLCWPV